MGNSMWKQGHILVVVVLGMLAGCSEPRIDGSSQEAMARSLQVVRESLSESEQVKLNEAIGIITFKGVDLQELFSGGAAAVKQLEDNARRSLDGKTADQIISEARDKG